MEVSGHSIHKVTSLDGPRGGEQMEIGSPDRLQEGVLSQELSNGVNCYSDDNDSSMETEQKRAGSVPPRQCWVAEHGNDQQQPSLNNSSHGNRREHVHHVDMEDAQNLVNFSAIAGTLAPSPSTSCLQVQPLTKQLYEKFTQEMGPDGARIKHSLAPDSSHQSPENMNTLQTALNHAKHGHKPPNCNCEGPDCPDYLEWLEKKIKLATSQAQSTSKTNDSPHLQSTIQQPNLQNQSYLQTNGGHLSSSYPQQQQRTKGPHTGQVPYSKLPPIPCSPQVLSIAKERNVSLQTAIAIEALTQLSGTGTQGVGLPGHILFNNNLLHHQHSQNLLSPSPNGTNLIPSSRSQSVPPGLHTDQQTAVSCEHHRPQSQGQPPHASTSPFPGQGNPQGFGQNPQQWLHDPNRGSEEQKVFMRRKSESLSHYAGAPHARSDPMTELKQLLGDTSSKSGNASFKLPVTQQLSQNGGFQAQDQPALPRIKQEPDSDELYHHSASMGHGNVANGQFLSHHYPGSPLSPGQAAIRHSTQAALQQHLHYKRNLFSNHPSGFGAPVACQNLKKWWPQMEANGLTHLNIKQEPKEPKKKKNGSPVLKAMSGMLPGPPLPKPKQIIIKKTKQKASVPTFLPKTQITTGRANTLTSLQPAGSLPPMSFHSNSSQVAAAGLPAQAQSQVSISNLSLPPSLTSSASSANTSAPIGSLPPAMAHATNAKPEEVVSSAPNTASPASYLTSTSPPNTSQLPGLINIDPKYEELIRQFEAEFGDSAAADTPSSQAMSATDLASQIRNKSQSSGPDPNLTASSNTQITPFIHTPESSSTPHMNSKDMAVNKDNPEAQREVTSSQTSIESPMWGQRDIIQQQQQHSQIEDAFSIPCSPLPKRMKIETTGDVAVLSTTCYSEDDTPTKNGLPCSPSLKGFLESPLQYLDTPTKNLLDTPSKDLQAEFPTCTCVEQILEKDEGPYYNHLGSGPTVASIRDLMETRYGEKGDAIRIEKVVYTGREGKSSRGCPIAKWVIRRSCEKEKLLCLVRHRAGHHCANAVIIILIMAWEGVPKPLADKLYRELSDTLTQYGNPTSRRCGLNDDRTCACQGKDPDSCGASFSFGCSWSMYFNGCKYARSKIPRKFRLQGEHPEQEDKLRNNFQHLATELAPLYKQLAPQAYSNQCQSESKAPDCRLGLKEGRPFAGVTACMDFCAHAHKDQHNLYNGCTVVCTLTKEDNRVVGEIPEDEQLHVLPLYKVSTTDEFGSEDGQLFKMQTGAIQMLQAFRREVRKLPEPAKSCRQRRLDAKKAASEKKKNKLQQPAGQTPEKTVVKAELCITESPQHQVNKAIVKQEVKPIIKKEPFNGSIDGYSFQAANAIKNMYPQPAYYARGGLPTPGQPSAADPVNGYNHNLPASRYSHYNYPPNALFPPKMRTYEARNAGTKAFQVDQKPDIHNLQARQAHAYPGHTEPTKQMNAQSLDAKQPHPFSVSSESSNRDTPVIKQEPMDMPVCEDTGLSQAGANTPSNTPNSATWPGNRLNGSIGPANWENQNCRQSPEALLANADKQRFHQHSQQQPSPYPQPWTSFPGSNSLMASPASSPVPQVPPSHSPHLGAGILGSIPQGSPRPSTPHPSTPQPGVTPPFSLTDRSLTPHSASPRQWVSPAPSPQPNAWATGHAAYSPGLKHSNPAGAYPDKMWSKTGESRCSTPLGVQEKAWKSCGGSVAGSTPSPAPEGRLFPDALQQSDQSDWDPSRAEYNAASTKGHEEDDDEVWSDSEHNFLDPNIGGVAVAPAHGSILFECARRELHATTPLKRPDRSHPTRISLVFYQHKNLHQPVHGLAVWEAKMKLLAERALQRQQEAALLGLSQEEIKALSKKRKWGVTATGAALGAGQSKDKREGPVTRLAPSFHTTSMVTASPYAFTRLTGPYSYFV
ncbi:methylcytosine dioxygenase TET3-like [Nerophis lumbriciformis]|uniref:methylcytosine dioxygenase TET3-like n=1 Tax=Nerophis lumbriciformis TaxID=546530 RepID=UPI003BAB087E